MRSAGCRRIYEIRDIGSTGNKNTTNKNEGGVLIFKTVDSIIRILNVYIVSRKETGNE